MSNKSIVKGWNKFDTAWVLNLFGTAVGAGVLFLPINAGRAGFWTLVVMAILVGPMTYFAHRGLSRFVLSSSKPGSDITEVVEEHFGQTAGKLITLLYFFAIFPILLIYGNGITNTVDSFIVNQLGMVSPNRVILSFVLIAGLISIMLMNEKVMLKITEMLVFPLVTILFGLSLYLIPQWNGSMLSEMPTMSEFMTTLWITIPVLVFSFNHSPAISSFSQSQQREYKEFELAEKHASRTLKGTATMLLVFVMLFVFSCVLTLTPAELVLAKQQNISILSFLANKFDNPFISYLGPLVAFLAITSSFFGHYLGAREGIEGLYIKMKGENAKHIDRKKLNRGTAVVFLLVLWGVAILNPSILGLIESLGGPIIAMILFIMPMYAITKVPAMKRYEGQLSNIFVTVMGLIAISAVVYGLF
ncbi:HAAAP family serine/threonine permease [Pasteurella atlantica]|uniref:HAAAP family serine/threonine permease n=2 Tax=Pasteurellaceae TaxID=712 RepID=A0ACC6HNB3_9PAST|nr:HAAAP family serine/threonine permease [Pasteurella atlantica]MDP8034373.1 HAAAP family serine/threonine permease [Pasteurella atlantica]MDP8036318.1 HAAAP family serine/threonine permease [Pasteurella atlantica]MDP8038256.1 HAAAP family serine/threonine permease [Pasteurella atlantica]MDP8048609.1 HAAAP family serine/threonine permease [Pasteurella atlantica]MDP8050580.1 HAAAP family serine/threonine permease [Pasteurella atlantica]